MQIEERVSWLLCPRVVRAELDSRDIPIDRGFKQGCVLAPDLFKVYLDTVIRQLQPLLQKSGSFRMNGDLQQYSKPTDEELLWILLYADDIALITESVDKPKTSLDLLDTAFSEWGLTVSTGKTKVLIMGRDVSSQASDLNIKVRGVTIEVVPQFKYLGSMISADNTSDGEINHRVASAGFAWHQLKMSKLWCSKYLTLTRKVSEPLCCLSCCTHLKHSQLSRVKSPVLKCFKCSV